MSELLSSGYSLEDIVSNIADDFKLLNKTPIEFRCNCSKEKFERGLISLCKKELLDIIIEDGKAETVCHFCNEHYDFTKEELIELAKIAK